MEWPDYLAELERCLDDHERALREGAPPPPALYVMPAMGPIPPELTKRAQELADRVVGLEQRVAGERDSLASALARAALDERQSALYVDLHA